MRGIIEGRLEKENGSAVVAGSERRGGLKEKACQVGQGLGLDLGCNALPNAV